MKATEEKNKKIFILQEKLKEMKGTREIVAVMKKKLLQKDIEYKKEMERIVNVKNVDLGFRIDELQNMVETLEREIVRRDGVISDKQEEIDSLYKNMGKISGKIQEKGQNKDKLIEELTNQNKQLARQLEDEIDKNIQKDYVISQNSARKKIQQDLELSQEVRLEEVQTPKKSANPQKEIAYLRRIKSLEEQLANIIPKVQHKFSKRIHTMESINFALTELLKTKKKYIKLLENYCESVPENVVQKFMSYRTTSKLIVKKIGQLGSEIEDTNSRLSEAMIGIK